MSNESDFAESGETRLDPSALRGADDHLNPAWIERLRRTWLPATRTNWPR
jgi:hypothetical protein